MDQATIEIEREVPARREIARRIRERRDVERVVAWAGTLCASLVLLASPLRPQGAGVDTIIPRDTTIAVGSYRLHYRIYGRGTPTVVLESGGGADGSAWNALAPRLARETGATVVSYDRAGFGTSDLPASPYDIAEEIAGAREGLRQLGLDRDVVLVGHSYGGMQIAVWSGVYPEGVRALVFVDPFTVHAVDALGGAEAVMAHRIFRLPFSNSTPNLTKVQRAVLRFHPALPATSDRARRSPPPRDVPAIILSAARPLFPDSSDDRRFKASHRALAADFTDANVIVAERSGHDVPNDEPDLVVGAVVEAVRTARQAERRR